MLGFKFLGNTHVPHKKNTAGMQGVKITPPAEVLLPILQNIGVLIDGKYIESRNTGLPLRGSDNQNILILDPQLEDIYQNYLAYRLPLPD